MRYILLTTILVINLYSDFIKAEVGAGGWMVKSTGEIGTTYANDKGYSVLDFEDDLGLDSTLSTYFWANFKHFIPVIPNARIEVTKFGESATENLPNFETKFFDGKKIKDQNVHSKLNLDQIDAILYYNLLDDTFFITADIGFGMKYYTGEIEVDDGSIDVDFAIPIVYGRFGARIPMTNITAETDLKYFKFTPAVDAEMYDFRFKIQATILELVMFDVNLEAGYRVHRLQLMAAEDSFSDFDADIKTEVSGFFGGLNISF